MASSAPDPNLVARLRAAATDVQNSTGRLRQAASEQSKKAQSATSPRAKAASERIVPGLRATAADILELAQVRLELLTLDAYEAGFHVAKLAAFTIACAAMLSFGLCFLAMFLTVLAWDSHPLLALGLFTAMFLIAGLFLLALIWIYLRRFSRLFAATRGEWQRDSERLRGNSDFDEDT
jgi:uncharacterized membrane protein YqjE